MKKLGRNEPCHCGSGKKYKNCHQKEDITKKRSNNSQLIIAAIILVLLISFFGIYMKMNSTDNGAPGPAPEGKVWSPEHGHWHDA